MYDFEPGDPELGKKIIFETPPLDKYDRGKA